MLTCSTTGGTPAILPYSTRPDVIQGQQMYFFKVFPAANPPNTETRSQPITSAQTASKCFTPVYVLIHSVVILLKKSRMAKARILKA